MQITIQTKLNKEAAKYLEKAGEYTAKLRGELLCALLKEKKLNELKKTFISERGILARQFNSLHSEVKGIIKSVKELRKINLQDAERRKKALKYTIKKLARSFKKAKERQNREKILFALHHKKRKLRNVENRIEKLKNRGICLGGRKLFKKQFHLEENSYENHQEWREAFRKQRNNRIFFIGSKDEKFGNQNCQMVGNKLKVRVIPALEKEFGSHVDVTVEFSYKQDIIFYALQKKQAMNYRFVRKKENWYLFVTTKYKKVDIITNKNLGAIGVDLNHSHITVAETNRHGNLVHHQKIHTLIQDRTCHQVTATLAEACKQIISRAVKEQKPVAIEKLDFSKKKSNLISSSNTKYKRMISSFAYSKFAALIKSQAMKNGVKIIEVNPAFTSVIGRYKFAHFFGISTHLAASLVIARRAQNFSERFPTRTARCLPVDRHCHVWKPWKAFLKLAVSDRERQVELLFCSRHLPF
ncbi:IS200/IS605 family accessory protein TnpB-related protein [Candidatus Uabimicrobium helgolandensis]